MHTRRFENERTRMLRTALGDFIHLHIEYHARALEKYTEMYKEHDRIAPEQIEARRGLPCARPPPHPRTHYSSTLPSSLRPERAFAACASPTTTTCPLLARPERPERGLCVCRLSCGAMAGRGGPHQL